MPSSRANRVTPGETRIVTELVSNLEALLRYHDAVRVLADSGLPGGDPFATYLAGFSGMMCGDLEAARLRAAQLAGATGDVSFMREELAGMVARADALIAAGIELGSTSLTAWHAVINGGLLLHESPFGYQEGMRGRYAYVADSEARMHEGIERVQAFLAADGRRIPKVVAAPDRASRILAIAMAKELELPLENWEPGGVPAGLVVAWDMDSVGEFEFLKSLRQHAPAQLLFAHASAWVDPFSYTPDLTTVLYQTLTHPWLGGALKIDPVTHRAQPSEPDPRSEEELAGEILAADPEPDGSIAPAGLVESIATALARLPEGSGAGVHRQSGQRRRQRAGSPVGSNRFL